MKRLSRCVAIVSAAVLGVTGCAWQKEPPAPTREEARATTPLAPLPQPPANVAAAPETPAPSTTAQELRDRMECEVLFGFQTLMTGERMHFAEHDRYTADPAQLSPPDACPDGSRAPLPEVAWLAGCHFRYAVSVAGASPGDTTYTVHAVGAVGAAEGLAYTMTDGQSPSGPVRVWPEGLRLESCHGVREPTRTPLPAPVCEGAGHLRGLFMAEKAYFQERDRYSEDLAVIGFLADPCLDGSRAPVPDDAWGAGCHFVYRVEVSVEAPAQTFVAMARGVAGSVAGLELRLTSDFTWSPAAPDCP